MAIYAIGDLHLSFQTNKPMNIFSDDWHDYENILKENWQSLIKEEDTVIIPGDFSWAMYLDEAVADFDYLNKLNGKKILVKGNHDYWWETRKKMNEFLLHHGFSNVDFLHNNHFEIEGVNICGTKGYDKKDTDDKIINREILRFEMSYNSIKDKTKPVLAVFHFPPEKEIMHMLAQYGIERYIYGHIHGIEYGSWNAYGGTLVSADYVGFKPVLLY